MLCYIVDFCLLFFFFFKQKTAYEMRISDWSSDVCSSDLVEVVGQEVRVLEVGDVPEIDRDAEDQQGPRKRAAARGVAGDQAAHDVVERHAAHDQQQVRRIPPSIKEQQRQQQPGHRAVELPEAAETVVHGQDDGQERQDEHIRVEQHPLQI